MCNICDIPKHIIAPYKDVEPPTAHCSLLTVHCSIAGFKGIIDVIERVYSGSLSGFIDKALWLFTAKTLFEGVEKGYGKQLLSLDYDSPDKAMLQAMRDNVFVFSAFKTEKELRAMTDLLTEPDGKPKAKGKFIAQALELHQDYDIRFLNAEYDNAIKSAQSASQWVQIQADKEAMPFLKYVTVHDARVRPEHRTLDKVTLPVDDPFWDTFYPPNGWGCRCDVVQTDRGKLTDKSKIVPPDMLPIFKNNVGKNGIVFPAKHPYFSNVPKDQEKKIIEFVKEQIKDL